MNNLLLKLKESWSKLNEIVKWVIIVGLFSAILFAAFNFLKPSEYEELFGGLSESDAIEIQKHLSDKQLDFITEENGTTILVKENASLLRGQLASLGFPKNPEVTGLNKFDEMSIGSTEFDKQVQYQTRLQEDLERSIVEAFDMISNAKVKLPKIEETSIYKNEEKQTKISVAIQTKSGETITPENVRAIQLFVSSSIQGVEFSAVEVLDSKMNVLSTADTETSSHSSTTKQIEIQNGIKERIEKDLITALQTVYGDVQVISRVEVDFDEIVRNIEKYDPQGSLVSNEVSTEQERTIEGEVEGVVGAEENAEVPGYEIENLNEEDATYLRDKEHIIENFSVGKTVEKIIQSPELRNVSLTVIVDDTTLTEEQIADLEETVAVASGLTGDPQRGNANKLIYTNGEVKVTLKEFKQQESDVFDEEEKTEEEVIPWLWIIIGSAVLVLLLLVFLFLAMRRKKKKKIEAEATAQALEEQQKMMLQEETIKERAEEKTELETESPKEMDRVYNFEWTEKQQDLRGLTNELTAKFPKETADVIKRMMKK